MPLLRALIGLVMVAYSAIHYFFGMLFTAGSEEDGGVWFAFGVFGLLGIWAPIFLCGLHLILFHGQPGWLAVRVIMVGTLVATTVAAFVAMMPHAFTTPQHPVVWDTLSDVALITCLFGWPMVGGLVIALLDRANKPPPAVG
jgi:hypothetical protein